MKLPFTVVLLEQALASCSNQDYRILLGSDYGHYPSFMNTAISTGTNDIALGGLAMFFQSDSSDEEKEGFLAYFQDSSCSILWSLSF